MFIKTCAIETLLKKILNEQFSKKCCIYENLYYFTFCVYRDSAERT